MQDESTHISLKAYALVMAGLGAGISLRQATTHAGISIPQWEESSSLWQARLEESAATDLALLMEFDAALLLGKRDFDPRVSPIDEDKQAWVCFRRHFVTSVDPVRFLAERGLTLSDYARTEADWSNRIAGNAELGASIQSLMQAPLEACPVVTLKPSPLLAAAPIPAVLPVEVLPSAASVGIMDAPVSAAPMTQPLPPEEPQVSPLPFKTKSPWILDVEREGTKPEPKATGSFPKAATMALPVFDIAPEALPFKPKPAESPTTTKTTLSREQYASLCAALAVNPQQSESIFRGYGLITQEERAAVDRAWKARLAQNPAEYQQWQQLYAGYMAHWLGQKRGT
jgi:hypothetical protein